MIKPIIKVGARVIPIMGEAAINFDGSDDPASSV
jgi:hypothetical protein